MVSIWVTIVNNIFIIIYNGLADTTLNCINVGIGNEYEWIRVNSISLGYSINVFCDSDRYSDNEDRRE